MSASGSEWEEDLKAEVIQNSEIGTRRNENLDVCLFIFI